MEEGLRLHLFLQHSLNEINKKQCQQVFFQFYIVGQIVETAGNLSVRKSTFWRATLPPCAAI